MILLDYILLAVLVYFTFWGFKQGLIRAVGSFLGLIIAVVITSRYFEYVAERFAPYVGLGNNQNLARIIAFVALLIVVNRLVIFIVGVIHRVYVGIAVIPGMKLSNRLLGAALGLIEGATVLGLVIYFAGRFPFGDFVQGMLSASRLAPIVLSISALVQPLLPEAIRQIRGLI